MQFPLPTSEELALLNEDRRSLFRGAIFATGVCTFLWALNVGTRLSPGPGKEFWLNLFDSFVCILCLTAPVKLWRYHRNIVNQIAGRAFMMSVEHFGTMEITMPRREGTGWRVRVMKNPWWDLRHCFFPVTAKDATLSRALWGVWCMVDPRLTRIPEKDADAMLGRMEKAFQEDWAKTHAKRSEDG